MHLEVFVFTGNQLKVLKMVTPTFGDNISQLVMLKYSELMKTLSTHAEN